jgi:hypothetical protein
VDLGQASEPVAEKSQLHLQFEVYGDGRHYLDWSAVQQGGLVMPLPDGVEGRTGEFGIGQFVHHNQGE